LPDVRVHLQQAQHNEAFFAAIDVNSYGDWAVTVLFYAALHYIDAYLAQRGHFDPGSHDVRDGLIRQYGPTRQVARQYFRLKSFSGTARYYGGRFAMADIAQLRLNQFEVVKTRMTAEIS
jgi:hypothetical protein